MDAFAEVLHILEVLHPEGVEDLEVDFAFDFAHDVGAEFVFFRLVEFFDGGCGGF